jgi:hypothetical protein
MIDFGVTPDAEGAEISVPGALRLHVHLWSDRTLIAGVERSLQLEP